MRETQITKQNINDLTEGTIWKKLVLYFIPIAAGALFQQLYNAVDAIVVGRFVGTEALAAVGGSPATVTQLILGFFIALSGGAAVIIAQLCGARDEKRVHVAVNTSLTFCLVIGFLLMVVMYFCAPGILSALGTPEDTMEGAVTYLRIYFAGSIFMLVFNMGSGILRAVGDSRKPFIYLVVSCISNIVLDLVFVIVFKWGVAGVAWATTIAQFISSVCIIVDLIKTKDYYRLDLKDYHFDFNIFKRMMSIGVPTGIQSAMYGVSNIILQIGINSLGTVVVASWAMSGKIDGVYWALVNSFGIAVTNFVAQNYGAGKYDRIKQANKTSFIMGMIGTVFMSVILLLLGRPLLGIFTQDANVVKTTWFIMICFVPTYVTWTAIEVLCGILRGLGDAVKPTIIIAIGVCALRIVWIFTVFHFFPTLLVLCLAYPVSWVVTDVALYIYYKKQNKKLS